MQRLKVFLILISISTCFCCSDNSDPSERELILGTWTAEVGLSLGEVSVNTRTVWNFLDRESGIYSVDEIRKNGDEEAVQTNLVSSGFNWEKLEDKYYLYYTNVDLEDTFFTIKEVAGVLALFNSEGALVASKEFAK